MRYSDQDVERFWSKVTKAGDLKCWLWTRGCRHEWGYGVFSVRGVNIYAHRFAMLLAGHEIDGRHVCHHCDNPPCVNPAHLFIGSNNDNRRDMVRKGRSGYRNRTACGNGHPYTPETTYYYGPGKRWRICRICKRAAAARLRSRRRNLDS